MTPFLARVDIYPLKSLDGVAVQSTPILPSGALQHDRAFALFDPSGQVINGKRDARIHQVRSRVTDDVSQITLWTENSSSPQTFHLGQEQAAIAAWFSDYFQRPVTLQQNPDVGFPDDTDSPGPTLISTATLESVAAWYGLTLEETRQRFRTNLEIGGVPAFWEDHLFSASGDPVPFQIGTVSFQGINPCQRCIVPTRDPATGEATAGFQKQFIQQRSATVPDTIARSRFNHFYRLAVNTRVPSPAKDSVVRIGDVVALA